MEIYEILEFNKVLSNLEKYANTELGTKNIKNIKLEYDKDKIEKALDETNEALVAILRIGDIPIGELLDISPLLKRCSIGASASIVELVHILEVISTVSKVKSYVSHAKNEKIDLPLLYEITEYLDATLPLKRELERCIEGEMLSDHATENLFSLRRQIKRQEAKIKEELNTILNKNSKMLTEKIVTLRNGRYVLPVRLEHKNSFKGIMHDQSASGNTIYIEPQKVVQLTNDLNMIIADEKKEVAHILMVLSGLVAENYEVLYTNLEIITHLDYIFAKGRYAKYLDATKQDVNIDGITKLFRARHPLINKEDVVANDILLGEENTTMIITGPNTGGKTVALKTMGLLSLMTQVGMLIPAKAGSVVAIFDRIFADIGDEQSIEQSLSTFSSHMKRIINIIDNLEYNSLVLLDEVGAGTDPKEGVALAYGILKYLKSKGTRVLVTTHYSELKTYAYEEEGVMNASVEFNKETLKPTYRLLLGTSGSSNAFYVSERLGLDEKVLKIAREYNANFETNVSKSIKELEERKISLISKEEKYIVSNKKLQEQIVLYENKLNKLEVEREEVLKNAFVEANTIINSAKELSKETIDNLKELSKKANKELIKQHEINQAVSNLNKKETVNTTKRVKTSNNISLKVGDQVYVPSINSYGELLEFDNKGYWTVSIGALKTKLKKEKIEFIRRAEVKKEVTHKTKVVGREKFRSVMPSVDLHGMRFAEAMEKLDKYLDDVMLQGYEQVTINHGIGSGALKNGVADYLKNARFVKSFRGANRDEGGLGVTIVRLK